MLEAIILTGGFGTRLQTVLKDIPKSMAPVNSRPFLEYLLGWLESYGVGKVMFSVGYRSEMIIDHFGSEYKGIEIDYAIENEPLGTGGGLRLAIEKCQGQNVLALNGDTLFLIDLQDFKIRHLQQNAPVSIALRMVDDVSRYGSVKIDETFIVRAFGEKSKERLPGFINGGIYLLNRDFYLRQTETGILSLEKDCFESWCRDGLMAGFPYKAYFRDIGIPEDYSKAQNEFKKLKY